MAALDCSALHLSSASVSRPLTPLARRLQSPQNAIVSLKKGWEDSNLLPISKRDVHQPKWKSAFVSNRINGSNTSSIYGELALQLAVYSSIRPGNGGGALSIEMNIFQRIFRIVQSYINSFISVLEDPEKILDQTVIEMNSDMVKMRQATAQVLASQKMIENKCNQSQKTADDWYKRARLALEKGDEVLAKEALKRRKSYEENAQSLRIQLKQQTEVVDKLMTSTRALEGKIAEAKSKKDILIARAQSARTSLKVNELVGNVSTSNALAAFEKMEEKVMALEAESEALGQLTSDDLVQKFNLLEGDTAESDLAELRNEMQRSSKKWTALPSTPSFLDLEVEKELSDLRRKAREF